MILRYLLWSEVQELNAKEMTLSNVAILARITIPLYVKRWAAKAARSIDPMLFESTVKNQNHKVLLFYSYGYW